MEIIPKKKDGCYVGRADQPEYFCFQMRVHGYHIPPGESEWTFYGAAAPADLALQYNVCVRTIRRWLLPHMHKIGKRYGRLFTPLQVQRIYDCLGLPDLSVSAVPLKIKLSRFNSTTAV